MAARASLIEFRFPASRLNGRKDAIPDFLGFALLSGDILRQESHENNDKADVANASHYLPLLAIRSRSNVAVLSLPRPPPPPRAPAPPRPPPPPPPWAMSRGVRPCLSFLSSRAPFSAAY